MHYLISELGVYAQIAQLVEQWTENPRVAGSIPALGTKMQMRKYIRYLLHTEGFPSGQRGQTVNLLSHDFDGSNPSPSTTIFSKEVEHRQAVDFFCFTR